MSSITEIYVCKLGQELKKGKILRQTISTNAKQRSWMRVSAAASTTPSPRPPITRPRKMTATKVFLFTRIRMSISAPCRQAALLRESLIAAASNAHAQTKVSHKPRHSLFSMVVTFFTEDAT